MTLLHPRPAEAGAIPAAKIGDAVKNGQKLSLYGTGDYVTSPVTGAITALAPFPGNFGRNYTAVSIASARPEVLDDAFQAVRQSPSLAAAADFLAAAPGVPGLQRLADAGRPIKTLVVCGVDQDLLVFTQQYVLAARGHDIQRGIRILKETAGIEEVVILTRKEAVQGFGHIVGRVYCGYLTSVTDKRCPQCKRQLTGSFYKRDKPRWLWVAVIVCIASALFTAGNLMLLTVIFSTTLSAGQPPALAVDFTQILPFYLGQASQLTTQTQTLLFSVLPREVFYIRLAYVVLAFMSVLAY